jgi:hypothetical protein
MFLGFPNVSNWWVHGSVPTGSFFSKLLGFRVLCFRLVVGSGFWVHTQQPITPNLEPTDNSRPKTENL